MVIDGSSCSENAEQMPPKRPAAGGESCKKDSFLL